MNKSCLSLLKELEKKDVIKPGELKRAEFYLQFSDNPGFTRLDQAAQWAIDNLQISEQRAAEIAQKLKEQFPGSSPSGEKPNPLLLQDKGIVQFARQAMFANQTASKLNDVAQQAENKEESVQQEANKAAFEHNKRLLFRCYSGGLINMEQYKKAHSLLHELGATVLSNQEVILNWLIQQKIYTPNRKKTVRDLPVQCAYPEKKNKQNGWIKKAFVAFVVCVTAALGIIEAVSGERINVCETLNEETNISAIFEKNGFEIIEKPRLLLLYGKTGIRTCSITLSQGAETIRAFYQFNLLSANELNMRHLFVYRLLPDSSMNKLELAFIKKIREIDNNQIEQTARNNEKTVNILESHFLDISSNPALCKKMSQNRYSCPVNILYSENKSNDLTLALTISFDFLLKTDGTWALITADREIRRRLLKVSNQSAKNQLYSERFKDLLRAA